jgi:hypothetical protein
MKSRMMRFVVRHEKKEQIEKLRFRWANSIKIGHVVFSWREWILFSFLRIRASVGLL